MSAATRLAMLRRKMEGGGRAAVEDLRRREQEAMSLAKIEATAKRCPCCGMAIEREAGCNKMTCSNCQAFFCYRCGADVTVVGYKHFQAEGGCVLFDSAEILRCGGWGGASWMCGWTEAAWAHKYPRHPRATPSFS